MTHLCSQYNLRLLGDFYFHTFPHFPLKWIPGYSTATIILIIYLFLFKTNKKKNVDHCLPHNKIKCLKNLTSTLHRIHSWSGMEPALAVMNRREVVYSPKGQLILHHNQQHLQLFLLGSGEA